MRVLIVILVTLSLSACSGRGSLGNINLFGWLGGGGNNALAARGLAPRGGFAVIRETRPLVPQISGLSVERTATGAIIRATASLPSEGYQSADLVFVGISGRVATYDFRARPPTSVSRSVPPHLREIVAAVHLTQWQLAGVNQIRVQAASNSRTVRR